MDSQNPYTELAEMVGPVNALKIQAGMVELIGEYGRSGVVIAEIAAFLILGPSKTDGSGELVEGIGFMTATSDGKHVKESFRVNGWSPQHRAFGILELERKTLILGEFLLAALGKSEPILFVDNNT